MSTGTLKISYDAVRPEGGRFVPLTITFGNGKLGAGGTLRDRAPQGDFWKNAHILVERLKSYRKNGALRARVDVWNVDAAPWAVHLAREFSPLLAAGMSIEVALPAALQKEVRASNQEALF